MVSSGDALGVLERGDEFGQLLIAHFGFLAPNIPPTADSRFDFTKDRSGASRRNIKILQNGPLRSDGRIGAGLLGNPCFQFSLAIGKRIDVESRSKSPELTGRVKETMLVEMIIDVGDEN